MKYKKSNVAKKKKKKSEKAMCLSKWAEIKITGLINAIICS